MVELSRFDLRVIQSALRTIADSDVDQLIRQTVQAVPDQDPDDVAINCLSASMTARDLLAYLAEVAAAEWKDD